MNQLYKTIGITKQSFHQWKSRERRKTKTWLEVYNIVQKVRVDHPGMGIRTIWRMMGPDHIGRDEFEYLAHNYGLGIAMKRNFRRTTDSRGVTHFENMVIGKRLTGVNQTWVSDITYYRLNEKFYYLTFIMDLYSRKVIGYSVSKKLYTECTTLKAVNYAIQTRAAMRTDRQTILHSDGGGQYYDKEFIRLLRQHNIQSSMGKTAYENPHAERLNRTLKNQYIKRFNPTTFEKLKIMTIKACLNYNNKPHQSLNYMTPNEFESSQSKKTFSTFSTSQHINNNDNILNL